MQWYIPKKGDPVDEALAGFINNFPEKDKMKILFLRESEGVYMFGQKKIHIKVEKGNQILIRVGGGFLTAQEFLETYTNPESDKAVRRDVISRFHNKIQTQRISSRFSSHSAERLPISRHQRNRSHSKHERNRSISSSISQSSHLFPRRQSLEKSLQSKYE